MRVMKWSMIALAVSAGTTQFAMASSQDDSKGFIEDSTLTSKTRMLYMNRDFKNGAGNIAKPGGGFKNGYREDWGLSELLNYSSGFTQGTIGVGVDAFAMGTLRLDGGAGRQGNGLFASKSDGSPEDTQSKAGGAIKFRLSDTVLKYGNQFVASPVFSTDDSRLLPEVATGTLITSHEIKGLELSAGRFTAISSQTGMYHDSLHLPAANIAGATYQFTDNFVGGLAASDVDDYFKKQYINLNYTFPIDDSQALNFDFNGYRTSSQGKELAGNVDNKIWSLAAAYSIGAHKFTLAHQRSTGDSGYYYGVDGGGTIFLANSVQYSDFNGKDERSWQARYDLNMATYGVPGLSFMARYITGDNISTDTGEGKEHEFNFESKYVMQEGPAKDLSFRLRSAVYRNNGNYNVASGNTDNNDVRIIVEYPLNIL
ncbi:OprD family porin [Pseudomonas helleri]|jgi:imipenem/basic amino acid-specific outer membrane pore|uniref:Outer membrane porin, OprD family n=1 Tax=Pseudomonas helleri TaxID=1608996 RepID=A0A6A7ZDS4_9PSED|nr:OprD family porin [Pseudomonas helleri]KMN20933.1 porin [Pseudomonas helleri]MQT37853.1 outer membrane porin, OprD family [Pseudomonas helleri]MQU24202.1 outer membrane porin, OprD family [Pseudomonas helleri]MQU45724.1 outer membrane porin, OprD family [Pseudomonas helleri]MQU59487.1 outer membrane porin, OprD family [Pseudomonas helleri]